MKRSFLFFGVALICSLSSCYVNSFTVGRGAQTNVKTEKWNHYAVFGLAPVKVSDAKELAGGAADYTVTVSHSFVNGLVSAVTFGLYSPTTTTVTK